MGNASTSGLLDEGLSRTNHQDVNYSDVDGKANGIPAADGQFEDAEDDDMEDLETHVITENDQSSIPRKGVTPADAPVVVPTDSADIPVGTPADASADASVADASAEASPDASVADASAEASVDASIDAPVGGRTDEKTINKLQESPPSPSGSPLEALASACEEEEQQSFLVREGATERGNGITCTDVLLGRGGQSNHHPGNIFFRRLVRAKQGEYFNANKREKTKVALDIVRLIRGLTPPGRFLKKDNKEDDLYIEVGDKKARDKASQALREGAPELREELREYREELHDEDSNNNQKSSELKSKNEGGDGMRSHEPSHDPGMPVGISQSAMMNMGGARQHPFLPFFTQYPFVSGSTAQMMAAGQQLAPQVVQTPMGPAMLPIFANTQAVPGLPFSPQFASQQQVMMVAQSAMLQQPGKQGFVPGDMPQAAAAAAAAAAASGMGVLPWIPGQQQMGDPFLMHQTMINAGKRKMDDIEENNHSDKGEERQSKVRKNG